MRWLTWASGLVLLFATSCQTVGTRAPAAAPFYAEQHIDFAGWKRKPDCCVEKGAKIAVASGGSYASKAAMEIAEKGGNLIDAAVATAFVIAVERPFSAGLGGGGFMTVRLADGTTAFVDFRETAPRRATRDMYLDAKGEVIPRKSIDGALAVATPGFVAGLYEAHKRWGKLPWKDVLFPSIRLASEGFPVYRSLAETIAAHKDRLKKQPEAWRVVSKRNGEPLKEGDVLEQDELARSLKRIAAEGAAGFYKGPIAKAISDVIQKEHGILDASDLETYQVKFREPVRGEWHGYQLVSAPPPSAGGVAVVEMLNLLGDTDPAEEAKAPADYAHLLSQVMKRAYADRSQYIGDPDFVSTPWAKLIDPAYARSLRQRIDRAKNTPSREIAPGELPPSLHGTSQLSLVDSAGNAVTSTITINGSFGSALVAPGTGIFLNNEMDDFSVKPGTKNLYGLTGNEANAIAPGKRPVSSMTPTIVLKDGKPVLVVGGAGGSRIITSVFQVILNDLAVFPGDLRRSVFAPRVHHQWLPDRLDLEEGFPSAIKRELEAKGHEVGPWPWYAEIQAVGVGRDGKLTAVFDARDEGGAEAR